MSAPLGWLSVGALALAIAAGLGGYSHGVEVGRQRADESARKEIDSATRARDDLREKIETATIRHIEADQQRQAANREIVRESSQIIERPVYRSQCVDDDGVRLLDRAAAAANGTDRFPEPDGSAPGAANGAPVGRGDDGRAMSGKHD